MARTPVEVLVDQRHGRRRVLGFIFEREFRVNVAQDTREEYVKVVTRGGAVETFPVPGPFVVETV